MHKRYRMPHGRNILSIAVHRHGVAVAKMYESCDTDAIMQNKERQKERHKERKTDQQTDNACRSTVQLVMAHRYGVAMNYILVSVFQERFSPTPSAWLAG